jgi:hypothetical protein
MGQGNGRPRVEVLMMFNEQLVYRHEQFHPGFFLRRRQYTTDRMKVKTVSSKIKGNDYAQSTILFGTSKHLRTYLQKRLFFEQIAFYLPPASVAIIPR